MPGSVEIAPKGAFDLAQSADFGFGQRDAIENTREMRMAFVLDDYTHHAAVHAVQHDSGNVTFTVSQGEVSAAAAQAARVLSIDIDASGWDALGRNDPLIGNLQTARPGLRPPLFYSAYEAAAWAVLSARRPHQQMVALRGRLSADHGAVLDVGGQPLAAFPTPEQRLEITEFPGLPEVKITRPMESPGPR